jgi:DnaK suppressor protein
MEESQRKKFADLINQHISSVQESIESLKQLTQPISPDNAIGRLSRLEAIGEKSVNEANLRKAELRLKLLGEAAKRVQTEDYGICQRCEEEIPVKRLEILPESAVCINCLQGKEED